MRILSRFFAAFAALIFAVGVADAQPVITAFIGTPTATSHVGYFVLDFNDAGPNPEAYAFGWNYEGTPTGKDFLTALQTELTGPNGFTQEGDEYSFGYLVNTLGYNGRSQSGTKVGYWNFWLGLDGTNWTSSDFGVSDIAISPTAVYSPNSNGDLALSGGPWLGVRYVENFNTDTPLAPRTPQIAAAAPEPATAVYGVTGLLVYGVIRRRRNHRMTP